MGKPEVLAAFETDLANPGSLKSGEYLEEHILETARRALSDDREGLILALKEWISLRSDPKTMLAISVAKELGLKELRPDIESLRSDIASGKQFWSYYIRSIDEALSSFKAQATFHPIQIPAIQSQSESGGASERELVNDTSTDFSLNVMKDRNALAPDSEMLWKELTVFFGGLGLLIGIFAVVYAFTLGQSRAPGDQGTHKTVIAFCVANVVLFLASAGLLALRKRWAAVMGAALATLDVLALLAGLAGAVGSKAQPTSSAFQALLIPTVIWSIIALVIVRRTTAFLKATKPDHQKSA